MRACWGKRGAPVEVPVTGGNTRRVGFGSLNPFTGTRLCMTAGRSGGPEFREHLRPLRGTYKRCDLSLALDFGSCHTTKAALAVAVTLRMTFAWLPTACPEFDLIYARRRVGKQRVSAKRAHADIDSHATDFAAHIRCHGDCTAIRRNGANSGNL